MVALSRGWSLAGNHHGAMCGSFMVTTSRSSASQLLSPRYVAAPGRPRYSTLTVNVAPDGIGSSGVIRSSCEVPRSKAARRPSTLDPAHREQEVEVEPGQGLRRPHAAASIRPVSRPDPNS